VDSGLQPSIHVTARVLLVPAVKRGAWFLVALLPLVVAILVELALWPYVRPPVWFLLYPSAFLASWIGGLRAAVVASVIGAAFAIWSLVPAADSFTLTPRAAAGAAAFMVTGIMFGVVHERLRRATAAEHQAARERLMFAALVDASPDFIGMADPSGTLTYLNAAGRRMVGLPDARAIETTTILDYYPEDQRLFASNVILDAMTRQGHWEGETTFRHWQTEARIPVSDTHFVIRPVTTGEVLGSGTITRDISEIQQARDDAERARHQLRASLDDLDRAQAVAKVGSWRLDVRRNELRWTAENYRIFGIVPETPMTYEAFLACVHPDDRAYVEREWTAALRGQPYDVEHRIVADGEVRWVREKADLEFDENHGLVGGIGITHDITDRKRADDVLRRTEAMASGIVSIAADAIISIDEDQKIVLFNEGAEKIFGYSRAEAIGAPLEMLIPERLRTAHREHVAGFAAGETTARRMGERQANIVGLRKSGEEFPADAAISKLAIGDTHTLTVALRDVTEQKRFEVEQTLFAEMGQVLGSTLDIETILTNIGRLMTRVIADACIVYVLDERGDIHRLDAFVRDPEKSWIRDALRAHPVDRKDAPQIWADLEANRPMVKRQLSPEELAGFAQGEEHLRLLQALEMKSFILAPLIAHGRFVGAMSLISTSAPRAYNDADVRFAQEIAQRAALAVDNAGLYARAQRAIETRDDVLGIVAHDLRNPLAAILMQAELLREPGADTYRLPHKAAESILRSATRMNRLIEDLLDVTLLEQSRLAVDPRPLDARQLMAEVLHAHEARGAADSLDLHLDVPADLPDVLCDRDRVLQILENLVGNALKFTPPGGSITVGAGQRTNDVLFWVADSGIGIDSDSLPHVFDRFWQAKRGRRSGAGLGLAIARGLVEAHGGRMWVESTPGRGTTFFFTIPAALPPLVRSRETLQPSRG
jgi:PAS domain S-box-containing protein